MSIKDKYCSYLIIFVTLNHKLKVQIFFNQNYYHIKEYLIIIRFNYHATLSALNYKVVLEVNIKYM
jgi:hypothetical protein